MSNITRTLTPTDSTLVINTTVGGPCRYVRSYAPMRAMLYERYDKESNTSTVNGHLPDGKQKSTTSAAPVRLS